MLFRQVKIYYMKRKLHLSTHNNVGSLFGCCPSGHLPCLYKIHHTMQVVYKKLTPDEAKSKVVKSKFDWYKMSE